MMTNDPYVIMILKMVGLIQETSCTFTQSSHLFVIIIHNALEKNTSMKPNIFGIIQQTWTALTS
jgi:hypothetical protein